MAVLELGPIMRYTMMELQDKLQDRGIRMSGTRWELAVRLALDVYPHLAGRPDRAEAGVQTAPAECWADVGVQTERREGDVLEEPVLLTPEKTPASSTSSCSSPAQTQPYRYQLRAGLAASASRQPEDEKAELRAASFCEVCAQERPGSNSALRDGSLNRFHMAFFLEGCR
ncbi:unnamed protein product [Effrenium voratum]|uniref:SAP domain-containing protein n=1 Tax=Effrenium voratum TaxID=2562239 RepID=A0AA36IG70_9DINO|nr:unnamed protein product [Effrenium voratum]